MKWAHKKGDPACRAGPFDVHECAPPEFKAKQEDKKIWWKRAKGEGRAPKES